MKFCSVNGVQQSHIDIENRGLAYGDGLFTTAKIQLGKVQYLASHINRLIAGCQQLGIKSPSFDDLTKQLVTIAKPYSLAVLKVIITSSNGGRGYARSIDNAYNLIIMIHDYPTHYDELANTGIRLGLSKQKMGVSPMLAGLKHLNRLEQVLLRQELSDRDEDDLLVTNIYEDVIEATSANLFVYFEDQLYTPDVSQSGVNGIMRQGVLSLEPETIIQSIKVDLLDQAQAMFICNCVMGIMPVARFKNRALSTDLPLHLRHRINDAEKLADKR